MSSSYLDAAEARSHDLALLVRLPQRLVHDSGGWTIEWRPASGRCLVASQAIPARTRVFCEMPICVCGASHDEVAVAVLALQGVDASDVRHLQSSADPPGSREWAAGVGTVNAHGAGGNPMDPKAGRRRVIGLLASMMMHECCPAAVVHISAAADGSHLSLHTIRPLAPGEPISISYVASYQPTTRRRRLLLAKHGFICACDRCIAQPELVRAFRCPHCGEGPCSPARSGPSCRELICDECEAHMQLDDDGWAAVVGAAETCGCESMCERCMPLFHPFHHTPVEAYSTRMLQLPIEARASVMAQHASAMARLYAGSCTREEAGEGEGSLAHALVATRVEAIAVAWLSEGRTQEAAEAFADAGERFAAFYGNQSADVVRCARGAGARSLAEYVAGSVEVLAHH